MTKWLALSSDGIENGSPLELGPVNILQLHFVLLSQLLLPLLQGLLRGLKLVKHEVGHWVVAVHFGGVRQSVVTTELHLDLVDGYPGPQG